jgi:hypothetical protein
MMNSAASWGDQHDLMIYGNWSPPNASVGWFYVTQKFVAAKEIPGDRFNMLDDSFHRSWLQEDLRR